jgi:KDO2-lipid IV(A) lauroyltransferase
LHRFPRFVVQLFARLPLRVAHALGAALGWTMYALSASYRAQLRANLELAGLDRRDLRREAIASAGRLFAEMPLLWFRPHDEVAALVREVSGAEGPYAAHDAGKAIVFLTPHLGCFEITAQYVARLTPITVLYRRPKIGWLEPLMQEGRGRENVKLVPADLGGVRALFAAMRRGEPIGFLPDQVPGQGEGEWADFFGRPAYTMTLAAKLVERPDVACFVAYARRLPGGAGYAIVVRELPAAQPGERAVRRLNRALESLVRECPGQYLWGYNRYKAPKGVFQPAPQTAPRS